MYVCSLKIVQFVPEKIIKYTCANGCSVNSSCMLLNGASRNNPVGCIFSAASRSNTCVETLMSNKKLYDYNKLFQFVL